MPGYGQKCGAAGSTGKLSRKNVVAAVLAGSLVLAIDAGAQANRLDGESLGEDWLMAGVEDQVAWAKRMAEIFNKDEAFANALEGCLAGTLGITEGFAGVVIQEIRQIELSNLTAACITAMSLQ